MRNTITDPGSANLVYEIREIVEIAKRIEALGLPIVWENIGDPVAKGEFVAPWIQAYVRDAVSKNTSYAYSPTKGLLKTREYIAQERNEEGGIQITAEDILFCNGLGDAISKVYRNLHGNARIIGPNPAYPTHSSAEASHANSPHITYSLDPKNEWQPDLEEMEQKINAYPEISGILIVNPDNPTGYVYTEDVLRKIVALAKKYSLFIISDEIYSNLSYGVTYKRLAAVIDDVPAIVMRGISKEFPWPGARCGWMEFYNRDQDADFNVYVKSLIDAKMLEVCSTTLPQFVLPQVMSDARYHVMLTKRTEKYARRAQEAYNLLHDIRGVTIYKPHGAFYMTLVFEADVLTYAQTLSFANEKVADYIEEHITPYISLDKRFVYYLLASTGICVVPLTSGFNSSFNGFRFTLLEEDDAVFTKTMQTLKRAIMLYTAS